MIINTDNKAKIKTIASKMSKLGLGSVEELNKEIIDRFVEKEVKKLPFAR